MSSWKWLSRRMESEIISSLAEHAGKVREATRLLADHLLKGEPDEDSLVRELNRVEREADNAKRAILESLARSVMSREEKAEIARFVQSVDLIAAYAKAAALRLKSLYKLGGFEEALRRRASELASLADSSMSLMAAALSKIEDDPMEVITIAERIEDLEERADNVRSRLESEMDAACRGKSTAWCIVYHKLVETLEALTDGCEEAANSLRILALVRT